MKALNSTLAEAPKISETENDSSKRRPKLGALMNQRQADAVNQQMQMKQTNWNVKLRSLIRLRELFDKVARLLKLNFRFAESLLAACLATSLLGCQTTGVVPETNGQAMSVPGLKTFQTQGVVNELNPDGVTARIQHEEIPGFMPAMTMPFTAKDRKELKAVKAGDSISFRLLVTEDDSWIDRVRKIARAAAIEPVARPIMQDVEELETSDLLPEYQLTNHLGRPIKTTDFKGSALAFTFMFTRCPVPQYCPRMSANFSEVQAQLKALPNAPTNWHLLSISFDPDFDTPMILDAYAQEFRPDPQRWQFATGSLLDITTLGELFAMKSRARYGTLVHNLRTVVIDTRGRVQKIIEGNDWKPDELVTEMLQAARVPVQLRQ